MDAIALQQALRLQGGKVIIPKGAIADLDEILEACYGGQPLVLNAATPGPDDGRNNTFVRTGTSAFLAHTALPVVATLRLASGRVEASVRYALPVGDGGTRGWRFSDSFPDLPAIADWRGVVAASVPLDDLIFESAAFIVATHAHRDDDTGAELQPGLNFVGRMRLADQAPTAGVTGAIRRVFGYGQAELLLTGVIILQDREEDQDQQEADEDDGDDERDWDDDKDQDADGEPPRIEDIWAVEGARPPGRGILLSAPLGRDKRLGAGSSELALTGAVFRIYSPLSRAARANYEPLFGYTGALRLPQAGPTATASVSALQALGGDELLLAARFKDASVASLEGLTDVGRRAELRGSMDGTLQGRVDRLPQLQLKSAHLAVSMTDAGGVDVSDASVTLGLPNLDWTVFKDVLVIEDLTATVEVRDPFGTREAGPMDRWRYGSERVSATMTGTALAFGKRFALRATTKSPYQLSARLARGQRIALSELLATYPDSVPPLSPDPEIDRLAITAEHASGSSTVSVGFAGRLRSSPAWPIAGGLKLKEAALHLTAHLGEADKQVNGELSAVLLVGKVEFRLKARKTGADWRFEGAARPDQKIEFKELADKADGGQRLATLTAYGDFPESLTIKKASASLALPDGALGDVHIQGLATFEAWRFSLGPAAFEVTGLGGEVFLSKDSARSRARLFGSVRIGDGLDAAAAVQLGGAEVNTVVELALTASEGRSPSVVAVVDKVAGVGRFGGLLPAKLSAAPPAFTEFRARLDLTEGVYVVEGAVKDFGRAYLVYQGHAAPNPGSDYVFAAELASGFTFAKLLSELSSIDDLVSVTAGRLTVYSVGATDRAGGLTRLQGLVQRFVKSQAYPWGLPSPDDPVLASETGLVVSVTLALKTALWGVTYAFDGAFRLTSRRMQADLRLRATGDAAKTLQNPFRLPGLEITELRLQVDAELGSAKVEPTLVLLGHTKLGPKAEPLDLVTTLALAAGRPAVMSMTLDGDLKVRQFIRQCFAETARDNCPDDFVELTFRKDSRIYYYDEVAARAWPQEARPKDLKPGFNVEALADLTVRDTAVGLHFTLRTILNADRQPVGFTASGGAASPIKIWRLELASHQKAPSGVAYIHSPTLSIDAPRQGPWKFGLRVGVNLFDRAIGEAQATVWRTDKGGTRLEGKIATAEPAPLLGPLAFSFAYTREPGVPDTLQIGDLPDLKTIRQVFDLLEKIADLVATAEHGGCGDLARYLLKKTLVTTYTASPSLDFSETEAKIVVTLGCSTRLGDAQGPVVVEWIPVTIDFALPKAATLDSLAEAILDGVTDNLEQVARQLLQQPDKIAQFLALAFAEEGASYALDLLCRRIRDPKFPARPPVPIIPPAVPGLTGIAWAAIAGFVGTLAAFALWLLGELADKLKTASENQPPPKAADPKKLDTPAVTGLVFKDSKAQVSWRGVPFAGGYEYELTGPAPLTLRTGMTSSLPHPIPIEGSPPGPYSVRVRAMRTDENKPGKRETFSSDWSPSFGKILAPIARLAAAHRDGGDHLEVTWPQPAGGPWSYDHQLCLDGKPLQPQPALASPNSWAFAGLAAGPYTARIIMRGSNPAYAASDWSEPSNSVTKLSPPMPQALTFSDAGGQDRVRVTWSGPGPASGIAFDARLIADPAAPGATPITSTIDGATFETAGLPVATYRAHGRAYPKPASAILAASNWSASSACAIAKLPAPKIKAVTHRTGAEAWTDLTIESAVQGADVYYVRLVHAGRPSERVEFQAPGPATIRIPDDYPAGAAQIGVRAAKRDGSAIASDWAARGLLRLAAPTATCVYDRATKELEVRFEPAPQDAAISATLAYEVQVLTGTPLAPFGEPVTVAADAGTRFKAAEFPAGPVQIQVRTVAPQDAALLRSPWRAAQPAMRKLGAAAVTDVSYDPEQQGARVKLAAAGPGVLYEVRFGDAPGAQATANVADIACPNPFAPGEIGTRTVSARLASADPAVIDGDWSVPDIAFILTKYPQPTQPRLAWDEKTGQLTVSLRPTAGTEAHQAQLTENGRPFGAVVDVGAKASSRTLLLPDDLPAGAIAAQVRSSGPAPRTVPGDWIASNLFERPGPVAAQPQVRYTPGEDHFVADWTVAMPGEPPWAPQRVAVQVVSGRAGPVGAPAILEAAAYPQLSFPIDGLAPGEVRVRFRAAPEGAAVLPGIWTLSHRTLARLAPASPYADYAYVDGALTVTLTPPDPKDAHPDAYELTFADAEARWRPPYPLRATRLGNARAEFQVAPEYFPVGEHEVRIQTIPGANQIDGPASPLNYRLAAIGRPTMAQPTYAWGKLRVAWSNAPWAIEPLSVTGDAMQNRMKIRAGGGTVPETIVYREVPRGPSNLASRSLELNIDDLKDLPRGAVWDISVQAMGPFSANHGGSGPWSEPVSVVILDAPTGLTLSLQAGQLRGSWAPPPSAGPLTYELEFIATNDQTPHSFGNITTPSVDYDFNATRLAFPTPLEGPFTMRVRAVVDGFRSDWTAPVIVAEPTDAPTGLAVQVVPRSFGSPNCPVAVTWDAPRGATASSYELELQALARWNKPADYDGTDPKSQGHFVVGPLGGRNPDPIPRHETGLPTPSFAEDLWTYASGLYTVRVRAVVDGRHTAWTEPASFVIAPSREEFDFDTLVERLLRAAGLSAADAVRQLRQIFPVVSAVQLREKLIQLGYTPADIEGAVPRAKVTYRKTETSQNQIVDASHTELPTTEFDDALQTLSPTLTQVNVWLDPDDSPWISGPRPASICGLQCVFTDPEGHPLQGELRGRQTAVQETVTIPYRSRITRISGEARNHVNGNEPGPVRVSALAFFADGSEAPFRQVGLPQGQMPFTFEAGPGEEVFCFFGANYVEDLIARQRPYLAWLGVWMKHSG